MFIVFQGVLYSQNLRIGVYAGVNNDTRTSKNHHYVQSGREVKFNSENSYNYGLVASLKFLPIIDLNTSVLYTRKKVSTEFSGPADGPVNATLYFDYISIAPKVELNPILGLYFNVGPSIDFQVNTKMEQTGAYVENKDEIEESESIRFGMLFSIGYRLDFMNNNAIAAELAYDLGLSETNEKYGGKYSTTRAALIFYFR